MACGLVGSLEVLGIFANAEEPPAANTAGGDGLNEALEVMHPVFECGCPSIEKL